MAKKDEAAQPEPEEAAEAAQPEPEREFTQTELMAALRPAEEAE